MNGVELSGNGVEFRTPHLYNEKKKSKYNQRQHNDAHMFLTLENCVEKQDRKAILKSKQK